MRHNRHGCVSLLLLLPFLKRSPIDLRFNGMRSNAEGVGFQVIQYGVMALSFFFQLKLLLNEQVSMW